MNRELPGEKILHGARSWQHVIVPIGNRIEGNWIVSTKMTHWVEIRRWSSPRPMVTKSQRCEPVCGWPEHWKKYRAQHPELEQYWGGDDRACYPPPIVLPGAVP